MGFRHLLSDEFVNRLELPVRGFQVFKLCLQIHQAALVFLLKTKAKGLKNLNSVFKTDAVRQ
jgi:hypothetical protein